MSLSASDAVALTLDIGFSPSDVGSISCGPSAVDRVEGGRRPRRRSPSRGKRSDFEVDHSFAEA
ncbi:hypothetical protein, partial [Rathayibacter sp. AY1E1]